MDILQKIPIVADANPKFISLMGEVPIAKDKDKVNTQISNAAKKQIDKEF